MKRKGIISVLVGVLGVIFILTFDMMMGKPVTDISGPRSIFALIICGFFIIAGLRLLLRKSK